MAAGVHIVIAAADTPKTSPGPVASAITVEASTITDAVAVGASHGAGLDLFAPGVGVVERCGGWSEQDGKCVGVVSCSSARCGQAAYLLSTIGPSSAAALGINGVPNRLASKNVTRIVVL
ncbi:hypothetical protein FPV67DRAFT_1776636 [Lyophyllum atratum]|nr:hypothetical protein FPV67DRAFT_1776636 [Lyophyllum atratum]